MEFIPSAALLRRWLWLALLIHAGRDRGRRQSGSHLSTGYFVVGLRPAGDRRNFGSYALAPDTVEVAGFAVVSRYR